MPSIFEELTQLYTGAIQRQREELEARERAQSERVGPSSFQDWAERLPPEQQDTRNWHFRIDTEEVDPARNTATAAMLREREEVPYSWYAVDSYGRQIPNQTQPRQPESASRAQGGQMEISDRPKPLTAEELRAAKQALVGLFRDGYASWPLEYNQRCIWINNRMRHLHSDTRWSISSDYIYIGRSRDEGSGEFESPANRLAATVTIMGACGLQQDAELLGLFEKRLAKVLAGVYSTAIAPLAERDNGEPIAKMAWSASGGVAAWMDGKWVTPVTGEEVQVGEGWTVVETGEGRPVAQTLPQPEASSERVLLREDFDRWVRLHRFSITQTEDGRPAVCYGSAPSGYITSVSLPEARRQGGPNLEIVQDTQGSWGIAPIWGPGQEPSLSPTQTGLPTLEEANQQLRNAIDAAGNRGLGPILRDGRQAWACMVERQAQDYLRRFQTSGHIPHATVERVGNGDWYVVSMPASQLPVHQAVPAAQNAEDQMSF